MRLALAATIAFLLFAGSAMLLATGPQLAGLAAVAGGVGIVIASALLGLTVLAARWRSTAGYVDTVAHAPSGFYDEVAHAFDADDAPAMGDHDAAAV